MTTPPWCREKVMVYYIITKNHFVLEIASQCKIDFINDSPPVQTCPQCELHFTEQESSVIDGELAKLLSQGVITRAIYCKNKLISNIFIRPKSNWKHRLILNLAKLNESINYRHFKMESLNTAMHLISNTLFCLCSFT